ncbi:MAG TPA: serine/threonine-protein kinase, partial [Polyangiaceae bacterium]|nr:serine/threonine-protein kinase [Polyangiaceae bacterium]
MQQAQLQAGSTFNRYEIQSRLAVGGMAEVWLGWLRGPEGFQKQVVLKTMLPHLAESPDLVQMFINEASVAARLNHPNIAQVFDFGEYDGRYFIAMEYLVGRTLRQIAKRCRDRAEHLPMWFLLRVLCDACEGLHYAHEYTDPTGWLGLVHRDVSPENVMVSNAGQVKVLDFGAAHCTSSSGQTRMFVGKFHYVAPERIQGMPEDRRADIYSTGVILYEYLTGTRPFAGTQTEVLAQVMAGKLAESAKLALLDGEIVRILRKAMAKDPDHRYQTAAELRSDLLQFLAATDPHKLQAELSHYTSIFPELKARFDQSEMRLRASTPAQIDPLAYLEQSGSDSEALQLEIEVDDDDLMVTAEAPIASVGRAAGETVRPQTTAETVRPHQIAAETVRPEAPEIDELFARLWDSPGVANVESEPEPEPAAEGGGVASDREASSAV